MLPRSLLLFCFALWNSFLAQGVRHLGSRTSGLRAALHGASPKVPVDFFVFVKAGSGSDGVKRPAASSNIGGADRETGFYTVCKSKCKIVNEWEAGCNCTSPRMDFCSCIAELLVHDLNEDFSALGQGEPAFEMGTYKEVNAGSDLFNIEDGHAKLHLLMKANDTVQYHRRTGRLTVWIANHIEGHTENTYLGGTTYLDQPLYSDSPGGAVLFNAGESRANRLLAHEVGHVVGFHHVAGPEVHYTYHGCSDGPVEWHNVPRPDCEPNIMGSWYDGPYCCPWSEDDADSQQDQQPTCLANSLEAVHSPYCCGELCRHKCSKDRPPSTFATHEHKTTLSKIFGCWRNQKGRAVPEHRRAALLAVDLSSVWECEDVASSSLGAWGPTSLPCFVGR